MNIYLLFNYFLHTLIRLIHIQLFLTIISLPLLTWWGLPISLATIIGNIIFAPWLSGFLLVCSLIFFTELCHIPNSLLYTSLNVFTDCWIWLLSWSQPTWLISLPKPPLWFCLLIPLAAVLIEYKQRAPALQLLLQGSLLITASLFLAFCASPKTLIFTIKSGKKEISCVHAYNKTYLIDTGATAAIVNPKTWCEHTLLCELRKHTGSTTIDGYIILRPSIRTLMAAKEVLSQTVVKNIFIPYWQNQKPSAIGKAVMSLKKSCIELGASIRRISNKPIIIALHDNEHIAIDPQSKIIKTSTITYQQIIVLIQLASQTARIPSTAISSANHRVYLQTKEIR